MADKCHAMLVPDNGEPINVSADGMEAFCKELYRQLLLTKGGLLHVVIDGRRYVLSQPQQVFRLKPLKADCADALQLGPCESTVYDENGRYSVLVSSE